MKTLVPTAGESDLIKSLVAVGMEEYQAKEYIQAMRHNPEQMMEGIILRRKAQMRFHRNRFNSFPKNYARSI